MTGVQAFHDASSHDAQQPDADGRGDGQPLGVDIGINPDTGPRVIDAGIQIFDATGVADVEIQDSAGSELALGVDGGLADVEDGGAGD